MLVLRRSVLVSILMLLAAGAAPALAASRWTPLGPFGGWALTFTVDPTDARVLYTTAGSEGAFKSVDGGLHWLPLRRAATTGNVAVDPARPRILYLAVSQPDQVLRSTNGGASWAPAHRGLPAAFVSEALAVDPAVPSRVYLGSAFDGVWHSLNRGGTWRPARSPLPAGSASVIRALVPLPRPAGTVYAVTFGGLFVSADGGDTWRRVDGTRGLPEGDVRALAAAPSNPRILWAALRDRGIYLSRDGGASWAPTPAQPVDDDLDQAIAVSPASPLTAWVGTLGSGAFVTTDGGATWRPTGLDGDLQVDFLAAAAGTVYAGLFPSPGNLGGIVASTDGGATWGPRNQGLAAVNVPDLAVDPRTPRLLWAAAGLQGLFRSANRGVRWVPVPLPPTFPDPLPLVSVAVSADGGTVYAADIQHVQVSDDGGASWRPSPVPDSISKVRADPRDPVTAYTAGFFGLAVSHDAGASWGPTGLPSPLCSFGELAISPSSPATLYATVVVSTNVPVPCRGGRKQILLRSRDGGATWTDLTAGLPGGTGLPVAVDPADPLTVYVVAATGLRKSVDGGDTWRELHSPNGLATALAVGSDGTIWAAAGGSAEVFASRDGGATWRAEGAPQAASISRLVPDPADPRRVYAATTGSVWLLEDIP